MKNEFENDVQLQLLVDGQLEHCQRGDFLKSLPSDSPVWRTIALRFVENQILNESLSRLPESVEQEEAQFPSAKQAPVLESPRGNFARRKIGLAIAASLLLGTLLGWSLLSAVQSGPSSTVVNTPVAVENDKAERVDTPGIQSTELRLQLADALSRSIRPVSLNTRRAFLRAGYLVDESRTMAKVELPTGSSVEMPVRKVTVRYLGQEAYQ